MNETSGREATQVTASVWMGWVANKRAATRAGDNQGRGEKRGLTRIEVMRKTRIDAPA